MRIDRESLIEFIDALEDGGYYFAIIERGGHRYKFGISRNGYRAIRKAMQSRPFDMLPGLKYRCFYLSSQRANPGSEDYWMDARVELARNGGKVRIEIPKDLHANLLWLDRLENLELATPFEIPKQNDE